MAATSSAAQPLVPVSNHMACTCDCFAHSQLTAHLVARTTIGPVVAERPLLRLLFTLSLLGVGSGVPCRRAAQEQNGSSFVAVRKKATGMPSLFSHALTGTFGSILAEALLKKIQ
eukprot:1144209-Amphidinium_carterae.1